MQTSLQNRSINGRLGGSSVAFRNRLVVSLLQRRESLNPVSRGFTLVELMIVVAIVGILSAVALPNFLQARSAALIGSRVGEAVGFAKECAVRTVTGIGVAPSTAAGGPDGGVSTSGCGGQDQAGAVRASWGTARADGVRCLSATSTSTNSTATVSISASGSLSCAFG
ncbi:MAG: type IV pilin protein [Cyanobium sp.]